MTQKRRRRKWIAPNGKSCDSIPKAIAISIDIGLLPPDTPIPISARKRALDAAKAAKEMGQPVPKKSKLSSSSSSPGTTTTNTAVSFPSTVTKQHGKKQFRFKGTTLSSIGNDKDESSRTANGKAKGSGGTAKKKKRSSVELSGVGGGGSSSTGPKSQGKVAKKAPRDRTPASRQKEPPPPQPIVFDTDNFVYDGHETDPESSFDPTIKGSSRATTVHWDPESPDGKIVGWRTRVWDGDVWQEGRIIRFDPFTYRHKIKLENTDVAYLDDDGCIWLRLPHEVSSSGLQSLLHVGIVWTSVLLS